MGRGRSTQHGRLFEETFLELSREGTDFVMGMNTIKNRGCCMGEGEDRGGRGQPSEDFSKHQHMPW